MDLYIYCSIYFHVILMAFTGVKRGTQRLISLAKVTKLVAEVTNFETLFFPHHTLSLW